MASIVLRSAKLLNIEIDEAAAALLASRARGTPRVANRLLRRARDYAQVRADGRIDVEVAKSALEVLGIDDAGLDEMDRRVLALLCGPLSGQPVGLGTLAVSVQEEPETIEDVVEPYLIRLGFLARTSRGRLATASAYRHLKHSVPSGVPGSDGQTPLFDV